MDFSIFKKAVAKRFAEMSKQGHLFRTAATGEELWNTYLKAFPPGSDPIFRERTEHDCNCCKAFVRAIGNVVAIGDDYQLISIWDINIPNQPEYQIVADAMSTLNKSKKIVNIFLHHEAKAGTDRSFDSKIKGTAWFDHFFVNIDHEFVRHERDIPSELGERRTHVETFSRALNELTLDAVETVNELIKSKSFYRCEDNAFVVKEFLNHQRRWLKVPVNSRENFAWKVASTLVGAVTGIRNTSIGTLLVDISEGRDLDEAVKAYESMVAPWNYKRPTALVTPKMIAEAKKDLEAMGLISALDRRPAEMTDVSAENVIFANRSARAQLRNSSDVFGELISGSTNVDVKALKGVQDISIADFIANVVPTASSIDVLVENRLVGNFATLVTSCDPTAGKLFKWGNPFSWSYSGEMADSIKERVKQAGGQIEGALCCRLSWFNRDDLDFHMVEPNGNEIDFVTKRSRWTDGQLDVDMNAGGGHTRTPVENIFYPHIHKMARGQYRLQVHQFSQRETIDVGFEVEIEFNGTIHKFAYNQPVRNKSVVDVATIEHDGKGNFKIVKSLPASTSTKKVWDVDTNQFHPVSMITLSPNFWGGNEIGNKHYFFFIEGCHNDGTARPFFNEFLIGDLDKHRKVMEQVGAKMRFAGNDEELSGLGFSSTKQEHVVVRVTGKSVRTYNVKF